MHYRNCFIEVRGHVDKSRGVVSLVRFLQDLKPHCQNLDEEWVVAKSKQKISPYDVFGVTKASLRRIYREKVSSDGILTIEIKYVRKLRC